MLAALTWNVKQLFIYFVIYCTMKTKQEIPVIFYSLNISVDTTWFTLRYHLLYIHMYEDALEHVWNINSMKLYMANETCYENSQIHLILYVANTHMTNIVLL